jgi:hypothetical protein
MVALSALLLTTAGFKGCSQSEKQRNVAFARDIVGAFDLAGPIIARKKPSLAANWTKGTENARKLADAIAASDQTEIVRLLRDILPIVTEVVTAFKGDDGFEFAFALGQIGLNFFVNHYLPAGGSVTSAKRGVASAVNTDSAIVEEYRALPQFGCRLKPERCQ